MDTGQKIQNNFFNQVKKDKKLKNAYLLVNSQKAGININITAGSEKIDFNQPQYMASVGKMFTATLVSIFYEKGYLNFHDKISGYLDQNILKGLHVYNRSDFTSEIKISQLLNQTSGLFDSFWPLLENVLNQPGFEISPREAINWGKENLTSRFIPGARHYYSDTNYYLLGLILENITKKPFHELLHQYIFDPLGMKTAYVLGYSVPSVGSEYPLAGFYIKNRDISKLKNYPGLDYSGGGVVASMEDLLLFMTAMVNNQLIEGNTLNMMMRNRRSLNLSINYGYGIWMFKKIPFILPGSMYCWGCVGATGAFMFYHPATESYIIANFNDLAYRTKAIQFMLFKVVKELTKIKF